MPFLNRSSKDLTTTGQKYDYYVDWHLANPDGLNGRLQRIAVRGDGNVIAGNPTYGTNPADAGRVYTIINGTQQGTTTGATIDGRRGESVAVLDDGQNSDYQYTAYGCPGEGTNASGTVRVLTQQGILNTTDVIANPITSGTSGYDYSTDTAGVPDGFGKYIMMYDGSGDIGGGLELFVAAPYYGDATTGAVGRIYHYRKLPSSFGSAWSLLDTIDGPANPSYITGTKRLGVGSFGHSMAIQWNYDIVLGFIYQLAVGDPYQGNNDNRGRISLHRFDVSASSWAQGLVQEGTQSNGYWGWDMDLKNGIFAVSSPAITGTGRTEFVRVWDNFDNLYTNLNPTAYIQFEKSDFGVSPTKDDEGWFGHSLAIDPRDNTVLYIGSPTYDTPLNPDATVTEGNGRVYVVNPITGELRSIIEAIDIVGSSSASSINGDDRFGFEVAVPHRNPLITYDDSKPLQLVVLAEKEDKGTGPIFGSVGRIFNIYLRY